MPKGETVTEMYAIDTGYWEKKWNDTLGYLVFKEQFSPLDVLNARFRYDRRKSDDFRIQFDKTTYSVIQNLLPQTLNKREFWAALIAPTSAFIEGDWAEYAPRGEEFREIMLVKAINNADRLCKLPLDKRAKAFESMANDLKKAGLKTKGADVPHVETRKINREDKKYTVKEKVSDEEALRDLDDLEFITKGIA